jgi:hypothetical protein
VNHGVKKRDSWLDGLVLTGDGKTRSSWTTNPAGALRFAPERAESLAAFVGMEAHAEEIPKVSP